MEKGQLGSRAEFFRISYNESPFYRLLRYSDEAYQWDREEGAWLPPWFPDLDECRSRCTIGAAYAMGRYPIGYEPGLVCLNRVHFEEKMAAGAAAFREQVDSERALRDERAVAGANHVEESLSALGAPALRALALALMSARPRLEFVHPTGEWHADWSYEPATAAGIRWLGPDQASIEHDSRGRAFVQLHLDNIDLDGLTGYELRVLVRRLMAHHLQAAEKLAAISPEALAVVSPGNAEAAGTLADAIGLIAEPAEQSEYLTFGNLKAALPERWRGEPNGRWIPAIMATAPDAYSKKVKIQGQVRHAVFGLRLKAQSKMEAHH